MSEKMFNTRIIHKHDTAENWEKATGFIPKSGELIVYDIDANYNYERLKVGDGATPVTELPFWDENVSWNTLKDRPFYEVDKDTLIWDGNTDGLHSLMGYVYKVSDIVPIPEDFAKGGKVVFGNGEIIEFKSDELDINESEGKYMIAGPENSFMIIPEIEGMESYGYLPGTYFFKGEENYLSSLTINEYAGFGSIKLLDSKYLNCDQSLDITSNNPVTNKVISEEITKLNTIIEDIQKKLIVDQSLDTTSNNPVANKVISKEVTELNTAIEDIQKSAVGKNVGGTSQYVDGAYITAKPYAEIFNNYTSNKATGSYSHAEGTNTSAVGDYSHTEGSNTKATGTSSHAEGAATIATGEYSHAEGATTKAEGHYSHAEGTNTKATDDGAHAEGSKTAASGASSHAEGNQTTATGNYSHTEGYGTIATGQGAHAEGYNYTHPIKVTGVANSRTYTLSENVNNRYIKLGAKITYNDVFSTISDYNPDTLTITVTSSLSSEDLNEQTVTLCFGAFGTAAHVEGYNTLASANQSHAEGSETAASGASSHTEGAGTTASGTSSHAEGTNTIASASESHAEGSHTKASGARSHAEGEYTIAAGINQHAQGKYNIQDSYLAHIVGNGTADARSNAHTLDWSGNAWYQGDVYVGSTSGTNRDEGSKKLATEEYVTVKLSQEIYKQPEEPADAPEGALWVDTDEESASGGGGVTSWNDLTDKPELFSGSYNDLTDKPELFSGSYNDLTDKPDLPSGGGVTSWNDLTDKPFEETITTASALTWDGNTEGLPKYRTYYRVSDAVLTEEDLANGYTVTLNNGDTYTDDDLALFGDFTDGWEIDDFYGSVGVDKPIVLIAPHDDIVYGQKGIYFINESDKFIASFKVNSYTFETITVKSLDSKYLPEYLQLKDSKLDKEYLPDFAWRDITNKPFGATYTPSDTLTWDGDPEGYESAIKSGTYFSDALAYKISDATPTMEDLANGYTVRWPYGDSMTEQDYPADEWNGVISLADGYCFIATTKFTDEEGKICPKGTYFVYNSKSDRVVSLTIPGYTGFEAIEINKLSPKYLPGSNALAPVNMLDNSNFAKPVNQRGKTTYNYESNEYSIDRWKLDSVNLTVGDGCITIATVDEQGRIEQPLEPGTLAYGKSYTFAVKLTTGELAICSGILNENYYNGGLSENTDWGYIDVCYEESDPYPYVRIHLDKYDSSISIEWVALYEGEFTTNTLPDYQPKGYAAELLECQRYFVQYLAEVDGQFAVGGANGSGVYAPIMLPTQMRIVPTAEYYNINIYPFITKGAVAITSLSVSTGLASKNQVILVAKYSDSSLEEQTVASIRILAGGYIALSADL